MRLASKVLALGLLAAACCRAEPLGDPVPTLGFYITGETGNDVLDTIRPELARLGFSEATLRDISRDQLPVVTFRHLDGDEIRVIAGKQCAFVAFDGARVLVGTAPGEFMTRFSKIHADLKKYIGRLSQPHPVILEGEIPPMGFCPSEF